MKSKIVLFLRIIVAAILLQTLFFKFTGAPESKFIFSTLGLEPWGRWGSGIGELIASLLLLIPATVFLGAVMTLGIISGALASHLFVLGVEVQNDGGLLFSLACTVFVCSAVIVFLLRDEIPVWIQRGKRTLAAQKR